MLENVVVRRLIKRSCVLPSSRYNVDAGFGLAVGDYNKQKRDEKKDLGALPEIPQWKMWKFVNCRGFIFSFSAGRLVQSTASSLRMVWVS